MEQLILDPDSIGDLSGDKDYTSLDEMREDLLELPIYFYWVAWRTPSNLFNAKVKQVSLSWIDIIITAAVGHVATSSIKRYMEQFWRPC